MRKAIHYFVFLFIILQAVSARPWQKYLQGQPLKVDIPKLNMVQLNNGIKLYYVKNELIPKVSFSLFIDGGSFEETSKNRGISNLWGETITLGGSEKFNREKLAEILEQNAASFNFSAGFERAVFSFSSLSNFYEQGLGIVLEVIQEARFANDDFSLIKKQTLQSIKKRKENPGRLAFMAAQQKAYEGSIRSVISTTKSVNKVSLSDLRQWHKRLLNKKRMTIVVSGDFDLAKIKSICEKSLSTLPEGQAPDFKVLKERANYTQLKKKLFHVEKKIPQSTILLSSKGMRHNAKEYFAMKLFDFILGGDAFNSHLMQQIRVKEGWAYSVYSFYRSDKYLGNINIFAQSANKNVPQVIKRFRTILAAPEKYVNANRLAQAKQSLTNKYVFLYETPGQLASLHLSLKWDGLSPDYLDKYLANLNKVTLQEVLAIARKYYSPNNFFTVVVGPDNVWQKQGKNPEGVSKVEKVEIPL